MLAFVCNKYGGANVLQLKELEKPSPKPNEILVKVRFVSLNSWDWDILTGKLIMRLIGPFKPPYSILGADLSGTVEAIGSDVTDFQIGDDVFGDVSDSGWGGLAQFVTGEAKHFTKKPNQLSFEKAATLPQAGLLGYQGVRTFGNVKPGDKVLINGGGGGAGMFAIQIAKLDGVHATAIDRADKFDAMKSFGADQVYDYKQVDYTKLDQKFDVIIDAVANRMPSAYRNVLTPTGTFVMMGGKMRSILATLLASRKNTADGQQFKILMWTVNRHDLDALAQLVVTKKIDVSIDQIFDFNQTPDAMQYVGAQNARGKVVISLT
ncbi:NAD(P)-dependent alcohol dehydrogenase [Maritalea sp.]|uniref:NAD(P)-dependent alcohol dehydrogenase n=1 Tax=Maritalea sp. TaxID=2003361 RepID=UPI003EF887ED